MHTYLIIDQLDYNFKAIKFRNGAVCMWDVS